MAPVAKKGLAFTKGNYMDLPAFIANYYSKLSITCDSPIGKVIGSGNYILNEHVEQFAEDIFTQISKDLDVENCVTETVKQSYKERKVAPKIDVELNAYGRLLRDAQYKRSNRLGFAILILGMAICGGIFVTQTIQSIVQIKKKRSGLALKHGLTAVLSVILFIIFERALRRI